MDAVDEMDFVAGPPPLAVEDRSRGDYGKAAEAEMAAKRADYFQAGTLVVWDVNPQDHSVRVFRAGAPDEPIIFTNGQQADAEPAVPDWRLALAEFFPG